jgi:hypothetical protein
MRTTTTFTLAAGLAITAAAPALAQNYQSQKDQQDREQQRQRMQDRMHSQSDQAWTDAECEQYFGKASGKHKLSKMNKLHSLAGPFVVSATFYGDLGKMADDPRRTQGFAERRIAFDGAMIIERFTFEGGADNLPLTHEPRRARFVDGDDMQRPGDRRRDGRRNQDDRMAGKEAKQGVVLWGYDPGAEKYTVAFSGSNSTAIRYDKGEINDQGQLVLTGDFSDPRTGDEYTARTVVDIISPDRQTVTMFVEGEALETRKKVYEMRYQRDENFRGFGPQARGQNQFRTDRPGPNNRNQNPNQRPDRNRD